jgi:nucleolar protein 4
VVVPTKKSEGKSQSAGFGFVQFEDIAHAAEAMKRINGQRLLNRTIAVDWALDKKQFAALLSAAEAAAAQKEKDSKDARAAAAAAEDGENDDDAAPANEDAVGGDDADAGSADGDAEHEDDAESAGGDADDATDGDGGDEDAEIADDGKAAAADEQKKARSSDVHRGTTLFIRNLAYETTEEELREKFSQYGAVRLAKVVMDREMNRPKGTAFVQFFDK